MGARAGVGERVFIAGRRRVGVALALAIGKDVYGEVAPVGGRMATGRLGLFLPWSGQWGGDHWCALDFLWATVETGEGLAGSFLSCSATRRRRCQMQFSAVGCKPFFRASGKDYNLGAATYHYDWFVRPTV